MAQRKRNSDALINAIAEAYELAHSATLVHWSAWPVSPWYMGYLLGIPLGLGRFNELMGGNHECMPSYHGELQMPKVLHDSNSPRSGTPRHQTPAWDSLEGGHLVGI